MGIRFVNWNEMSQSSQKMTIIFDTLRTITRLQFFNHVNACCHIGEIDRVGETANIRNMGSSA